MKINVLSYLLIVSFFFPNCMVFSVVWSSLSYGLCPHNLAFLDCIIATFFYVLSVLLIFKCKCVLEHLGANVAGGRGFYLKGDGARLNQALINFGLDFLEKKGYTSLQAPFFMRKDIMAKCAQLGQFDEELYKVSW